MAKAAPVKKAAPKKEKVERAAIATRRELVEGLTEASGLKKYEVEKVVDVFSDVLISLLNTFGKFTWKGVGIFKGTHVPARPRRNPRTGEIVEAAAKMKSTCKVSKIIAEGLTMPKKAKAAKAK